MAGVCALQRLELLGPCIRLAGAEGLSGRINERCARNVSLHFLLDFHDEKVQFCFEKGRVCYNTGTISLEPPAAVPEWVHRDQRYAEDATARARRKTPMLGGPAKSEQSANAPQCLGAPRSSTRRGPFVDANPIRGRPQIMAGPRPGSWRYRGARHRSLGHDNVWYRVAAGGRLGRQGVGAPTRTRVRPCLQRGPEPNLTPTLQTSARVLMPHRQQQTTPSSHQAQGRMAGLIGKDEYQ